MKMYDLQIVPVDHVAIENGPPVLMVHQRVLALTYEQTGSRIAYAMVCRLDTMVNVSDIVLSPTICNELRPEIEAYLNGVAGRCHITQIDLIEYIDSSEGEQSFPERLGDQVTPVVTFTDTLWSDLKLAAEDLRFDPVAYTRRCNLSSTTWEVKSVTKDPEGKIVSFEIAETTGGTNNFTFQIANTFTDGLMPAVGMAISIQANGAYVWASTTHLKDAVSKQPVVVPLATPKEPV